MMDTKSNLKIEDLAIKKELTQNPIWKLQVTDDKKKVLYERNYLDKNADQKDYNKVDPYIPKREGEYERYDHYYVPRREDD